MPVRVPIQFVKPEMRLAVPICDGEGMLVAGSGTALTESVVRALRKMAIQTVAVVEGTEVASWEQARPLREELLDLERRLDLESRTEPLSMLCAAITRHFCKRSLHLDPELGSGAEEPNPGPAPPRPDRSL